jgi:pantoate--beta-alanine ligase
MVVHRLLEIVLPDNLYLGQKDYQQCMVIKRLLDIIGLAHTIKIVVCPTLREPDGLAMSSRNMRLPEAAREKATAIFKALTYIKDHLKPGDLADLKEQGERQLIEKGFRIDYLEIVNATTLTPVAAWNGSERLVLLAAAFLNEVRLIDNIIVN